MNSKPPILYKSIENKTIYWKEESNKYIVLENATAAILQKISNNVSLKKIAEELALKLSLPEEDTFLFVKDVKEQLIGANTDKKSTQKNTKKQQKKPNTFEFTKLYKVNTIVFKVHFFSEYELFLVHPKFAHLEIKESEVTTTQFYVFTIDKKIYFYVDTKFIGSWDLTEVHFFQGKFSMELIQKIHQKEEDEWLGVFHASAVANNKKSILFLGDSGNGKSTSLALLQSNGFTCLADDFVPIDVHKKMVHSFPAAISIKKNSLDTLLPLFPELKTSAEYHFKRLNKIVRYLKPNNTNFLESLPCNDIVFIKYKKDSSLHFTKISKINAFQELVPDSWLSPIKKNASIFLEWFDTINCYTITYSNNNEMIAAVSKIFDNEL
ncbi:hypothetical protein [Polaribacter tangerinus]|uniref:hypothetical protein n=1 Tax=Polaribacter tangerinus TaxID=1920034 RepID=UPI000B4B6C2A|nr:hypothetical protein [Polaribacter tangerinus]